MRLVFPAPAACVSAILLVLPAAWMAGCRRDMQDQPKVTPLVPSKFFADGRSARPIPAGTIARGDLNVTDSVHTGTANGVFLESIPMPVNQALLKRGQERFDIFCSPCHGLLGDGYGMVARRGFKAPANFHSARLRQAPPGYVFRVITNGYGGMGDYSDQIPDVADRWAIVAYINALQLSRNATLAEVPANARPQLEAQR